MEKIKTINIIVPESKSIFLNLKRAGFNRCSELNKNIMTTTASIRYIEAMVKEMEMSTISLKILPVLKAAILPVLCHSRSTSRRLVGSPSGKKIPDKAGMTMLQPT